MFKNQFLTRDNKTGIRTLYWGTVEDWQKEDSELLKRETILPEEEYRAEDYSEMLGNVLEDHNIHKYTNIGYLLIDSMREVDSISEEQIKETVKNFALKFGQYHNLIRDDQEEEDNE